MVSTLHSTNYMLNESPTSGLSTDAILKRNNVRVIGSGKPPLLFCNGFGCDQQIWRHLIPALATHHQLVLFDHVGSGSSDLAAYESQKYSTLDGYAQDVVDICWALSLQQVVIIGHSVGATIALLATIQASHYFTQAILLAPSPSYLNAPGYHGGFDRTDIEDLLALMTADYDSWANIFANLLMGNSNSVSLSEELAAYFCRTDSTIAQKFAEVAFLADNRADMALVPVQTLILQCSQDVAAPAEVGAYLLDQIPNATLVTLQATGHCPHLSATVETLGAIEDFLKAA